MNKNTIAIVAFNKPDLLYLYLEQIFYLCMLRKMLNIELVNPQKEKKLIWMFPFNFIYLYI